MSNTKMYLNSVLASYEPTAIRGSFTNFLTPTVTGRLGYEFFSSSTNKAAVLADGTSTASDMSFFLGRWVSGGVFNAGTLSGTMQIVMAVQEGSTAQNAFTHVHAYVTVGDSDTVRGTLLSNDIGPTEWPTPAATISDSNTINSVTLQVGDRVVIEVGYRISGTASSTDLSATMRYGGASAALTGAGDTNLTTRSPWVLFSDPNSVLALPLETLVDDFEGVSLDRVMWPRNSSGTVFTQANGVVEVPTKIGSGQYLESDGIYTFANSSISARLTPPTIDGGTSVYAQLEIWNYPTFNSKVAVYVDSAAGSVGLVCTNSSTTTFSRNLVNPEPGAWVLDSPYMRLTESGGTVSWDVSQDGINWEPMTDGGTPVTAATPALVLASNTLAVDLLAVRQSAGTAGTAGNPATFDNVNVTPAAAGPEPGRMLLAVS
jgi:hypothetical protein